jgi:hypothetical protein
LAHASTLEPLITDASTIQKLALRSDLPRLKGEGFYLFAQLEPEEQTLGEPAKTQLLGRAFAALVAQEESRSERPLPALLPRAYQRRELSADWVELVYACDLAEPFERRNRAGNVLAVTKYLQGRVRVFKGAFAYFTPDDWTPVETLEASAFTPLE